MLFVFTLYLWLDFSMQVYQPLFCSHQIGYIFGELECLHLSEQTLQAMPPEPSDPSSSGPWDLQVSEYSWTNYSTNKKGRSSVETTISFICYTNEKHKDRLWITYITKRNMQKIMYLINILFFSQIFDFIIDSSDFMVQSALLSFSWRCIQQKLGIKMNTVPAILSTKYTFLKEHGHHIASIISMSSWVGKTRWKPIKIKT